MNKTNKRLATDPFIENLERIFQNPPLTYEKLISRSIERASKNKKPYWVITWKDEKGNAGQAGFMMKKKRAVSLFERTHPGIGLYHLAGSD